MRAWAEQVATEMQCSGSNIKKQKNRKGSKEAMQFSFIELGRGDSKSKSDSQAEVDAKKSNRMAKEGLFGSPQYEAAVARLTPLKQQYLLAYLRTGSPTETARAVGGVSIKHVSKEMKRIAGKLGFEDVRQMRSASVYAGTIRRGREDATASDLMEMLETQQYRCALSGELLTPAIARLDHIEPLANDGDNKPSNLQWVTEEVNNAKGTMSQDAFIRMCKRVAIKAGALFDFNDN